MTQATEKETIKVKCTVEITEEKLSDLLASAFEGGVGYWCRIMGYTYPEGKTRADVEYPHIQVVMEGGRMRCHDAEEPDSHYKTMTPEEKEQWTLTKEKLVTGLEVLAAKYPHHFAAIVMDNDDAGTADCLVQCALFGEIVYS